MKRREFLKYSALVGAGALTKTLGFPHISFGASNKPIKLGLSAPLSGVLTDYGVRLEKGTRLAVDLINEQGGILGRKVDLIVEDDKTFVFITDNELGYTHKGGLPIESYIEFSQGADLLIHDAEYTPEEYAHTRTWGHSTYPETLELGLKAGVKKLGLFHLNQDRTDQQMDDIVADCQQRISDAKSPMDCFAVGCHTSIEL